ILVRSRVGVSGYQAEPRFPHARTDAVDERHLPKRRADRARMDELLNFVQRRFAPLVVELACLLLKELVDVGIVAVDIGAALHHKSVQSRSGVAERGTLSLDKVLEVLLPVTLEEGRALERPQPGTDAYRLEIVEHGLAYIRVCAVAVVFTGIEAVGIAGRSQELSGLGRIVDGGRRLPVELEAVRDHATRKLGMPECQCLVHGFAVDR